MDIEDLDSLTYEKLLSSYSFIPQIGLDQISKVNSSYNFSLIRTRLLIRELP